MAKRILLADDSVTIQKVIELTFLDQDYEVEAVSNGNEALARLEREGLSLVIADIHMPGGASGYEVAEQSKARRPELPVLLLVGTFEPFDEERYGTCGADAYLKKPFDSQELLQLVARLQAEGGKANEAPVAEPAAGATPPLATPPLATPASPTGVAPEPFSLDEDDTFSGFGGPEVPAVEEVSSVAPEPFSLDDTFSGFGATAAPVVEEPSSVAPEPFSLDDDDPFSEVAAATVAPATPEVVVADAVPEEEDDLEATGDLGLARPAVAVPVDDSSADPFDFGVDEPAATEASAPADDPFDLATPAVEQADVLQTLVAPGGGPGDVREEQTPLVADPVEAHADAAASAEDATVEETAADEPAPVEAAPVEDGGAVPLAAPPAESAVAANNGAQSLSDDDVDRIARRVVELLSTDVVQDIAWDIVPDLSEVIIKERLRELESQIE